MIILAQQTAQNVADSPWIKVVLGVVALAFLALKITESVLKWRRERDPVPLPMMSQADPCKTCSRQVDDLHAWHAPEDVGSGRQSWKVPRDLVIQVDAIDRRTRDMERDLADLCAKAGVWNTTTSPGG